eukprot:COSAG05_NODE_18604_length_306_cov_0.468599_1_plen_51_part_10
MPPQQGSQQRATSIGKMKKKRAQPVHMQAPPMQQQPPPQQQQMMGSMGGLG